MGLLRVPFLFHITHPCYTSWHNFFFLFIVEIGLSFFSYHTFLPLADVIAVMCIMVGNIVQILILGVKGFLRYL